MAGAECMDGQSGWTIGGIVGQLLCLWGRRRGEAEDKSTTSSSDDDLTQEFLFFLSHPSITQLRTSQEVLAISYLF